MTCYATYQDSEIAFGDTLTECFSEVSESFYAPAITEVMFHLEHESGIVSVFNGQVAKILFGC